MSLLAPWFLAGLALIAGPVIAHLIRRATRERVQFSALRFVEPSAPRLDRRSRVQHPWLLALRCLIVAVLAFGFARPLLREDTPAGASRASPRHVVAVLDESASMRRPGLWDAARQRITALANELDPNDRFMLLTAGITVHELIAAEQWQATPANSRTALVRAVLADRQPGWGPTPLDSAAESALARWEELASAEGAAQRRELIFVSDFAAGSRLNGLAGIAWPDDAVVRLEDVSSTRSGNAALHWLGWSEQVGNRPAARVRLTRSFDGPESLQLRWRDARTGDPLGDPEPITLLPGGSEVRQVAVPENTPAALRLDLEGDPTDFDNRLWLVRPQPRTVALSYLAPHPADDPQHARFYLQRAIAGWRDPIAQFTTELPADPAAPALIVVPTVLNSHELDAVRTRLAGGGVALVLLDDDELVHTAAALAGESGWGPRTPAGSDALLGQLDFAHPLFAAFADPLYSNFAGIRFWAPRSIELPAGSRAEIVARFDDNAPAVIEVPVGAGRLVVWGGGWTPAASQWVLSSKFVPWLQALAERAVGGVGRPAIAEIGEAARLLEPGSAGAWSRLGNAHNEGFVADSLPEKPGVYELEQRGETREVSLLVPAAESQLAPLSLETWEQLGVPLHENRGGSPMTAAAAAASASASSVENRQQLWRWLLWTAVALLAFESVISLALHRRAAAPA